MSQHQIFCNFWDGSYDIFASFQVSTWFANARRRLKKENKMTWEPKNKLDDEDVDVSDEDEKDKEDDKHGTKEW